MDELVVDKQCHICGALVLGDRCKACYHKLCAECKDYPTKLSYDALELAHVVDKERISRLTAELAAAQETLTKRDSMLDKLTASHDRLTAENERLENLCAQLSADAEIQAFTRFMERRQTLVDSFEAVKAELTILRERLRVMQEPVSEREWADAQTLSRSIYLTDAERATRIIKDRASEPGKAQEPNNE